MSGWKLETPPFLHPTAFGTKKCGVLSFVPITLRKKNFSVIPLKKKLPHFLEEADWISKSEEWPFIAAIRKNVSVSKNSLLKQRALKERQLGIMSINLSSSLWWVTGTKRKRSRKAELCPFIRYCFTNNYIYSVAWYREMFTFYGKPTSN